jgi:hypothetical protein
VTQSEISQLAADPKQVFGADIWAFIAVAIITVGSFFALMVIGYTPLLAAPIGISLFLVAASLTAWDPFWLTRIQYLPRRFGRSAGMPIGSYRYPAG